MTSSNNNLFKKSVGFNMFLFFCVIGKLSLIAITALSLCSCKSAEPVNEPQYTDMFETRQYQVQVETTTNEIVTTVFVSKMVETNTIKRVEKKPVEDNPDFGGYDFDFNFKPKSPVELQCKDGSCGVEAVKE